MKKRNFEQNAEAKILQITLWFFCIFSSFKALNTVSLYISQVQGTAELARGKIKAHFDELRTTLNRQEVIALTTVDAHIREKLCMLRQQQEDMATLLSQVSAVCHQCEGTLQQVSPQLKPFQQKGCLQVLTINSFPFITNFQECLPLLFSLAIKIVFISHECQIP